MFALPMGLTSTSCSNENEVEEYYDKVLAEKVAMLELFKKEWQPYATTHSVNIYTSGKYITDYTVEKMSIQDGHYFVMGRLRLELLDFTGYSIGQASLYFK